MINLMSLDKDKRDLLCVKAESSLLYLVCFVVFRLAVCDFLFVGLTLVSVRLLFSCSKCCKDNFQTLGRKIDPCHGFGKGFWEV